MTKKIEFFLYFSFFTFVAGLALNNSVLADDSSSGSSGGGNAVPGAEKVDELVTNNFLRALSGSTSRWSFASSSNFEGGTIQKPLLQDRPDISGASATTTKTDIDSSVSIKFNIDPTSSISGGVGMRWVGPFHHSLNGFDGRRFDVFNPYFQYQYIYNFLGIQSVVQAQVTQWTQSDQTVAGYNQAFNIDQEMMYEIAKTGLSFGISGYIQYQTFNKPGSEISPDGSGVPLSQEQSQYEFFIAPILEYQITDKINLRTLVALVNYEHYRFQNFMAFERDGVYQSIGVGFSVTRDIFLYPNIQFLPDHIKGQLTNVGLGATVNLF